MLKGNPATLAIESQITRAYADPGQRALGCFLIHILGRSFGVRAPDATLLACSFDEVTGRLRRRGSHRVAFSEQPSLDLVNAFIAVTYTEEGDEGTVLGMSSTQFRDAVADAGVVWAPDGDAAFDDGGHVLQFDVANGVRLIAFRTADRWEDVAASIVDLRLGADEFYGVLEMWACAFEDEWRAALGS